MELVAANMIVRLKMNPAEYGWRLQGFPINPEFAISWSDVICLFTGIDCSV
jgi:hypothetical protein